MAPVMSSVTVASCVRSPSATVCSSFISRKMAAWLASFTRLASCSWLLGFQPLLLGHRLALAAVLQLHVGQADGAQDGEHATTAQGRQRAGAQAGLRRQLALQVFQRAAQRFAVGNDRCLRFARRHQALQVAQDGAGLRAGLLVQLDQRFQALARLRVLAMPARRSSGLPSSRPCAISLKEFKSLPSRNTASGRHAFHGQEFVGRLADTLRQHHQLAGCGDFRRRARSAAA